MKRYYFFPVIIRIGRLNPHRATVHYEKQYKGRMKAYRYTPCSPKAENRTSAKYPKSQHPIARKAGVA